MANRSTPAIDLATKTLRNLVDQLWEALHSHDGEKGCGIPGVRNCQWCQEAAAIRHMLEMVVDSLEEAHHDLCNHYGKRVWIKEPFVAAFAELAHLHYLDEDNAIHELIRVRLQQAGMLPKPQEDAGDAA